MKQTEQKILERIDTLIQKGSQARSHYIASPPNTAGGSHVDYTFFNEWKNSSENLIVLVTGEKSHYYKNFVEGVNKPWISHS